MFQKQIQVQVLEKDELVTLTCEIKTLFASLIVCKFRIGEKLCKAKQIIEKENPNGFADYVKYNYPFKIDQARNYIKAFR